MVSQDRWSLVTGSITLKCGTFCQEYLAFKDTQVVFHGSGLSREVLLYICQAISNQYSSPCVIRPPLICQETVTTLERWPLVMVRSKYIDHVDSIVAEIYIFSEV